MTYFDVIMYFRKFRLRLLRHHGLWWILLLLYSHVVHTSISILDCPMLRDPSDQSISPVSGHCVNLLELCQSTCMYSLQRVNGYA